MKSSVLNSRAILSCAAVVALAVHPARVATAASTIPDPCKLVTVAEIQQIVGPLSDLAAWKKRNGGKSPLALPEFGSDAFVNPDFEDSADLYAKKGSLILRVTMPKGPQSVEAVKAIARKALPRL